MASKERRRRGAGPMMGALAAAVLLLSIGGPATSAAAPLGSSAAGLRVAAAEGVTQVRHRRGHRSYYRSGRNCYGCLGGRDGAGVPCRC
jgi:hypothetical protein